MTSDKDQNAHRPPNYADHLRRVRQVRRTLDAPSFSEASAKKPPASAPSPSPTPAPPETPRQAVTPDAATTSAPGAASAHKPTPRAQISHESIKDQAISRKTMRPAEDYEIPSKSGSQKPFEQLSSTPPLQSPSKEPVEQAASKPAEQPHASQPIEHAPVSRPAEQSPVARTTEPAAGSADKPKTVTAKKYVSDGASGPDSDKRGSTQFVAKTLLDHNAILKAQAMRQKARVEQEISRRQQQPLRIVEPIKAQKTVRSCPFSWTETSSSERFKHCSKCQSTVYNLDGMEFAEAENLIFKRENRKKFVLFKRPDGKFMTSDCPVAKKRQQQLVGIVAVCVCLIACVIGVLIMMPPMPSPSANSNWAEGAPNTVSSDSETKASEPTLTKSSGTKSNGTVQHYEAGDAIPAEPAESGPDTTTTGQKPYSDSEEKGDFWEFSGQ